MGEVVDINGTKTNNKGGTMERKKPTAKQLDDRLTMIENLIGGIQQGLSSLSQEIFHINANSVALFRAVEAKGVITEEDIKESWSKHIQKPYEEDVAKAKAEATASTTGQDIIADTDEVVKEKGSAENTETKEDTTGAPK